MSGQFLNCPDSFWIVRTDFRFSGQFLNCWTVFELSVQFLSRSESAGLSRQVLDCPDSFYFVRTVLDCLDSLWIVQTISKPSGRFPCQPDSFERIYALSQKLSGFAKTFQIAMLPATMVFLTLGVQA